MKTYWCLNSNGQIIGVVDALTGDSAWALTQIAQPQAARIHPSWMPL